MGRAVLFLLIVSIWGCNGQPPAAVFLPPPVQQSSAEPSDKTLTRQHDFGVAKPSITLLPLPSVLSLRKKLLMYLKNGTIRL